MMILTFINIITLESNLEESSKIEDIHKLIPFVCNSKTNQQREKFKNL